MEVTDLLLTAMAYDNLEVKTATKNLIESLGSDLDDAGYETSSDTDEAVSALTEAINDADEATESEDDEEEDDEKDEDLDEEEE